MEQNDVKAKSLAFAKRIVRAYQYLLADCEELRKLLSSITKTIRETEQIPNS